MFDDYIDRFYSKLATRSTFITKNNYAKAKELAAWKEDVASHWDEIEVVSVQYDDRLLNKGVEVGDVVKTSVVLDKHGIHGNLGVEEVWIYTDPVSNVDFVKVHPMHLDKEEGSKLYFSIDVKSSQAGPFRFGLRIFPDNKDIPHRMDFAYVKWIMI
jgi:starch phosphorylase